MWFAITALVGFALGWFTCAMLTVASHADDQQDHATAYMRGYADGQAEAFRRNP